MTNTLHRSHLTQAPTAHKATVDIWYLEVVRIEIHKRYDSATVFSFRTVVKVSDHGVAADLVLPPDDLGGDDIPLEVRPS